MQGSAMGFVVGMFVAAVVGVIAAFVVQAYGPQLVGAHKSETPDTGDVVGAVMDGKLGSLEGSLNERIDGLGASIETLSAQVSQLQQKVDTLGESVGALAKGAGPLLARGEGERPVDEGLKNALNEALEERDRQRAQRMTGMQQMMQGMINTRLNEFAKEKNWNIAKQEEVKGIIDGSMKKMTELFEEFRDGPPSPETFEKIQKIMQETEEKLKEVMTEEEWKEFQESMPGPGMFGPARREQPPQEQLPQGR